MTKFNCSMVLCGMLACGCGGSSPSPDDQADAPIPEPVEIIEEDTGAAPEATPPKEDSPPTEESVGENTVENGSPDDEEVSPADPQAQAEADEPAPSADLQYYVNATTGYTPEYRIVKDNMNTFKQCYLDAMRAEPDLAGMLKIRFTVLKNGKVKKVKAVQNELNDQVEKCVINAFKKLKFPRRAKKRTVEYPFKFIPSPS